MEIEYLGDVFIKLGTELKKIAEVQDQTNEEKEVLLSKQDVLNKYPCFSSSSLNSAVKNGLVSYKVGRNRYYKSIDIDNWISDKSVDSRKSFIGF